MRVSPCTAAATWAAAVFFGNNFTLLNGGTIKADVSGQSLDIPSRVTLTNVTATGKLRLDPGATLNLNAVTTSGSGVIDVSGGTLNVGGTVTPEVFTNFTRTGGTVNLLGVLTNTGNTFTFNATTGTWNLRVAPWWAGRSRSQTARRWRSARALTTG